MGFQGRVIVVCCLAFFLSLLAISCGNKPAKQSIVNPAAAVPVKRTLPPLPARPLSPELQAMRERAMRDATRLRELSFTGDVGMAELSGWEYGTRTREMAEILGGDELRALSRLASAGGVLPEGADLATLASSFAAVSAGATYSPLDKQILLVKDFKGDALLTHEFVHALQDEHFDLLKLLIQQPYNFDREEAAFALVEGDAHNVERRAEEGDAFTRRSLDDIARSEGARFGSYRKEMGALFPPLLTETFIFRYRDGSRFVESIRRTRGERGVDELFAHLPASSEQILHPEKYQSGEMPREVNLDESAFQANGWQLSTSTPLGEIGIRGLLMAGLSANDAARAAAGWGGDRAFLFEQEGHAPLFVWKTVWDKNSDAGEFFDAYNLLNRRAGGRAETVEPSNSRDRAQILWHEGAHTTLVRRTGDSVIIIRGAESDVNAALTPLEP